jgi:hypothetical protein
LLPFGPEPSVFSSELSKNVKIGIYKATILPAVLYGCETRYLILRKKQWRRIFGIKRDKVTGEWRELHNEELRNLYSSPSIIRMIKSNMIRWAGVG